MLRKVTFKSYGHQLLVTRFPHPASLARALALPRSRVSEYRRSGVVPARVRDQLAGLGIPLEAWAEQPDYAPTPREPELPPRRELPEAGWDREPATALAPAPSPAAAPMASFELDPTQGIRGMMAVADSYQAFVAGLPEYDRAQHYAKLFGMMSAISKAQKEAPVNDAASDAGPGRIDCSHPWVRSLDYQHRALFQSVRSLLAWHEAHPDQIPSPTPARAPRLCVVDGLRGAALGVLDPKGYVTLVAPTELGEAALGALISAGWAEPVYASPLYEHDQRPINTAPSWAAPPAEVAPEPPTPS